MNIVALLDDPGITPALPNDLLAARLQATGHPCKTIRCNQLASLVPRGGSTRISHKLRRETPREAGWDKAGAESGEGCMRTYCPNHDSSPTLSQPASRKSQQMACEICGSTPAILVLNYRAGDFHPREISAIQEFHASGGSLLILGDTPSRGAWYPFRNSLAPEFHLTRCSDTFFVRGLTDDGTRILGSLPQLKSFAGRRMHGIRTSAYPPDETLMLLDCGGHYREVSPVVAIRRKCRRFFGAKLAMVGHDDGRPRENVLGVCNLPFEFDPGFLDPGWDGFDPLLAGLMEWLAPDRIALAIESTDSLVSGRPTRLSLRVRNMDLTNRCELPFKVRAGERSLAAGNFGRIAPGGFADINGIPFTPQPGTNRITAEAGENQPPLKVIKEFFARLEGPSLENGFGISTYRAFSGHEVTDDFRDFLAEMKRLGAQYVRLAISWETTEPSPGHYDWTIPDQLLECTAALGLNAFFWVFPTARGSGLGDAGIPEWTLREPSIDRFGQPGNFPCIWSPFYRQRYFGFLENLVARYARDPRLARFVFDFGNSDFPYTYHYYGDRGDLFDYSPHERKAFARYLATVARIPLGELSRAWGQPLTDYDAITIPYSENTEAWLIYDAFRKWGVRNGVARAMDIVRRLAPDKVPPDPPGHGLGAINDLDTFCYEALARNWDAVPEALRPLTNVHNASRQWGGEAWQVGARFADNDDALFQSVRLGASYLTQPGPDLGVWEDAVGKTAAIRRSLMGATRTQPVIAIMDRLRWGDTRSLAHVGSRLDQPVDLLAPWCRFPLDAYRLLVLPGYELAEGPRGTECLLPDDEAFWEHLAERVRAGMRVLVFPRTATSPTLARARNILGLSAVRYGPPVRSSVHFPESFGGGSSQGLVRSVTAPGSTPLLQTSDGETVLAELPSGVGSFLLAGYDNAKDSLDAGTLTPDAPSLANHSLPRLLKHLGLEPYEIRSGQCAAWKQIVRRDDHEFLLLYNHQNQPLDFHASLRLSRPATHLLDLASGKHHPLTPHGSLLEITLQLIPQTGFYGMIQPDRT